ncbi:hypothetical protein A0128_03640 [Leptospira tipperaryensis]|uniref:Uncharacterized protein n=1 Tax=Leptospira tipperaryensis TaxID=2564040 RepID=A0A1D7UU13_9LEPT|nr:hypothetical protein A0128_03640 [Leptospira tipperaryensis]
MSGLKELLYPLSNFEFLEGSKKLETILIDSNRKVNIKTLAKFPIKMVDIHFTDSLTIAHKIREEVRKIHPNCQFEFTRK